MENETNKEVGKATLWFGLTEIAANLCLSLLIWAGIACFARSDYRPFTESPQKTEQL